MISGNEMLRHTKHVRNMVKHNSNVRDLNSTRYVKLLERSKKRFGFVKTERQSVYICKTLFNTVELRHEPRIEDNN